jgi:hypothetical protein
MPRPYPKPAKKQKKSRAKYVPPRPRVKKELYRVMSLIVRWRDGGCVQAGKGRVMCWGVETDGHVIERADYGTTFDLLNNHDQCQGHNNWHRYHVIDYQDWFERTFGSAAWVHLKETAKACESEKSLSTVELEELLVKFTDLWENRPTVYDRKRLIELGYYGEWYKEHYKDFHL